MRGIQEGNREAPEGKGEMKGMACVEGRYEKEVERWGVVEVACHGREDGNPFVDYWIEGIFTGGQETVRVDGFYDGNGVYRVRFMPSFEGRYSFVVRGNCLEQEVEGEFYACKAGAGNHGPVRVANTYHFAYEDGTPYYPVGTTCYVWELQRDDLIEETFRTLKDSAFNKIRFCICPKHYDYNLKEPRSYPYMGTPMDSGVLTRDNFQAYNGRAEGNNFDYTSFNPQHFQHIESCIERLGELSIEADIIVMHPYDRWGFSCMTPEEDDLYWNYVLARFAAYRNVWWSLANEYDLFEHKAIADWERYAGIICRKDPYRHLRSIHNCRPFYDHSRPWITHCSIQRQDLYKSAELVNEWRERYQKPVVLDEIAYEGNIQHGWGNITAEELLRRFWEAACRGGYPGHGETYLDQKDILWWSHGGRLKGESHKRFGFLLKILQETPGCGLMPYGQCGWDEVCAVPEESASKGAAVKDYYLYYYSFMQPSFREFYFDDTTKWDVEVFDTWEMTRKECGPFSGHFRVSLPGKPYMAVRIRRKYSEEE